MTEQLLIYKSAVPVNREAHSGFSIEVAGDFSFCASINSVPLMAVEFPNAAAEFPIVFGGAGPDLAPVAILGIRAEENLFVGPGGIWNAAYVPAFLRRYPFAFSAGEPDQFVLCVDESYAGLNRDGRGQRLFADDGAPTAYTNNVVTFLRDYHVQFGVTRRFCDRIIALGLLEPMQAQVTAANGGTWSLGGFQAISREKLKALPADALADLAKSDELELIYLHLQSMRNFEGLPKRLEALLSARNSAA